MSVWVREPTCGRLIRVVGTQAQITPNPTFTFTSNMAEERVPPPPEPRSLNQIFYPPRSTNPSSFQIPDLGENVQFAFSPQYTTMLPKFSGEGDAYLFFSEFEEVCSMMQFSNVSQDTIRLRFIPFALKDSAKKWMHSLPTNSISTWDGFVSVFLRKYFPNGKTVKLRNEINHFV